MPLVAPNVAEGLPIPQEPYDAEQVRRICDAMRNQQGFQLWYQTINANRRLLRFREQGVEIQGISQKLEDPSPAIDVHVTRYVNRIVAAETIFEVSARSGDTKAINSAQVVEDFYYTLFSDMLRQQAGFMPSPYRRHIDDMAAYGAGFLNPAFAKHVREALPSGVYADVDELVKELKDSEAFKEGFTKNPFVIECPVLETVFFEPDLSVVCEVGQRTVSSLLHSYGGLDYNANIGFSDLTSDTLPENTNDWDDLADYYHLETSDFIYDVLASEGHDDAQLLSIRPNFAGKPWYSLTPGHINNSPDPSKMFQPLVAPLYQTIQMMNVTRTLLQSGALNTGRPMYQSVANNARPETSVFMNMPVEQQATILFDPSKQVLSDPKPGYHWEVVQAPSIEWVKQADEQSRKDLQDWGFPASLSPDSPTTGTANSAAQGAQQMDVATNYLDPALNNVARSVHVLFTTIGDIIIGMDVPIEMPMHRRSTGGDSKVREITRVTPDDFQEADLSVTLESIPAAAQIAINEFELREMELGVRSRSAYMRRRFRDHLAEEKRIVLDKALASSEQKILLAADQIMDEMMPALKAQVAAEQGIPPAPPPLVSPEGGPAPDQAVRFARPAVPVAGAGSPNPNPAQRTGGVPTAAGTEQIVTVQ